ncbi:ankyrin-3-like, partial [Myzus persicae]|uniref:ankyrin-3-like n=1 Tax=Myzus persicae TaxID=13164 RepID=UPI000B93342C
MEQEEPEKPKKAEGNTSSFLRAARSGNLDKVIEHLKNKIDINTSNSNGLNALHLASKDGHLEIVKELLKRGANVNSATKKGNTALHIASLAGQYDVVVTLVEHGALVNVQSQNGFTPLYMAAQENHDRVVKYLLANGANQNLATEDGFTPCAVAMQQGHEKVVTVLLENDTKGKVRLPALHIAAKKDDCKAADLLLQNDHNPDVTSKSGFTPLHIASHYGNDGIAKLLLAKGADVNYSAKHNITPLHVAAKWGKSNMVSLLLESGANIEAKTRDGLTALHCAARSGHDQVIDMLLQRNAPISSKTKNGLAALHMAAQGDHVEAAKVLLSNNAPVDDVTVDYLTGLHVAAHCGHIRVAKLLLEKHADPDARALNGFTPLHIACKKNRIKVVELLLKYNASLEATTESGLTPLHVASFMGCMNIVIFLLQHEANPDLPTVRGETPLHLAARANQTDIIRILLRNGAQVDARAREKQTPLHIASRLGNVDIVMLLLAHGAAVDSTTKDLYTALHIASKEGQEEVASVLLENEASVTATTKKGFTPLHLASKYGNIKVTKLLLQKQAPVDAQGKNGVTPLHVASHYDNQAVALMLLDKQASPHATAKNGHTPLHIAAKKNQMDIAVTLLDYGAKANAESKAGFTPLHLSSQEGNVEMTTLLLNHNADPNYKSKNGLTPMHLTAQEDKHKVAVVLDNYHADINPETKAGFTPLHVACHFGQLNMVRFITARQGVNINATTASGYTPLHQAAQQGHSTIVSHLLDKGADPDLLTSQGQTALSISQKLGYISVVEALKNVTKAAPSSTSDEKYKVISPETMQETFMSDSEDEGGDVLQSGSVEYGLNTRAQLTQNVIVSSREETMINEQSYRYLTGEEMKGFGDESAPIDVTRDERCDANTVPPTSIDEAISPQTVYDSYSGPVDNVDIVKYPPHVGRLQWKTFLVSFLVDARGGAMRGCRHSGVRVIVPPRRASMPTRVTCRYLRREKLVHPPPLMEGESLASRILELGPVGAKFLGPVMIEVPNFGSLRGSEREIVVLRSENGETWREHTVEVTDEVVKDILGANFDKEDRDPWHSGNRLTRIVTTEFPHYFAIVSRVKQEVHAIGPEGGMVSSTVVPQVQAVFPQGALTKRIKVGLQAQPIPSELTAKLLGNRVAVSPIVTVEPRRRKFHKPITLTLPLPQASSKGMINHYSGDAPTLRLLCSITGGTSRAQWEDVTGSTPLTFINDCVSFTTTVSARFWLMDCRNVADASKMATELYREAIHVPFMAKFVVFAKRTDTNEARIRLFCMTDDREDKTLEHKEHFTEVSNSRDVEVLEGKPVYIEFAGNLVPVTKSGEQLRLVVRAFKENRLPFTMRVKDPSAEPRSWTIVMKEPKVSKNEPAQTPVCVLQFGLPENIVHDSDVNADEHYNDYTYTRDSNTESHKRAELRITDISNFVSEDWINLAHELGFQSSDISQIQREYPDSSGQQCMSMLNLWMNEISGQDSVIALERALNNIGRVDVVEKCNFAEIGHYPSQNGVYAESEKHQSYQSQNNKYAAEEKAVIEDEIVKTVTERRMEIEQRLNGEPVVIDKKYEPFIRADDAAQMTSKPVDIPAVEPIEPTEVSFEHKRMSFERGVSIEQVLQEDIPVKDKSVILEDKKMPSIDEKPIDVDVDATSLTFHEKRLSFEQGIPVKEIIQKKTEDTTTVPAGHGKESTTIIETENSVSKRDTTSAEDAKLSDSKSDLRPSIELTKDTNEQIRRDSILFEEVSQGLVKLDSTGSKVEDKTELLSPQSSRTPPPSPAEFKDIEQQNESKQRQPETVSEKEPQTALWSQDNDDLLDTHGFGEHLNGIETPNLSKPKNHKSLADIDEEFEERSVVLHPFFDQPKRDIYEQVQFIKHHDDSPAFDSPLTDKSVSHHDTGISLTREYSDTLTSSGLKTKPKHTDTAFDEEAELTDNGLSPIQPDEVGLAANEIIEIKKKIGMYDAGNSPIIFMESIALSPFGTVTSDVATITDNVKKIDVANSPIESNKVQRNMDTTVDVKKMIMQLEKSGTGSENVTSQQSPKRKPTLKTIISDIVLPEENHTIHVDIEKKHKQYDTNTTNIQSKLDEVIKTEKCVLEHLEKVVDISSKNNSELESKLMQIVNIETSMLQSFDKIIDKHETSINNSCLKNLEKDIISVEKVDEKFKKVDTTDRLQQSPKKCSEDKIEKKYIDTGYRKEESIMEPIKVEGISKELKKLMDDDEKEQERMYRVLLNEYNTNDDKYSNKTPVVEEIITPKRVKPITKKDDVKGDSKNNEIYNITTNIKIPIKEKINNTITTTNLKENERLNIEKYETENNEVLKKDKNDKNKKIFYEDDEEDESDIFEKFTREHLKKSLDLSQTNVETDDSDKKYENKDIDFDIIDDEETETHNSKKEKSLSFIPKTIEKGLKDITMTLTSIVKKMDVNDMSGKKNENEGGDRVTETINDSARQGKGETQLNKNNKKHNTKNDLKSNITPQTPVLKRDLLIKRNIKSDNLRNESIEQCEYNTEKDNKKEMVNNFEKEIENNQQFKLIVDTNEYVKPVTSTYNSEKEINTNTLTTEKINTNKNNDNVGKEINKNVTSSSIEIITIPTQVNSLTNLTIKSEVKKPIKENQKNVVHKDDSNFNTVEKQIVGDLNNTETPYNRIDTSTNNEIETIHVTTSSNETYEKTETHTKTLIIKTNKEHRQKNITDIYSTTLTNDKLLTDENIQIKNLNHRDNDENIKQESYQLENRDEKSTKQNNKIYRETTNMKDEKVEEQSETNKNKAKPYIEGIETDKVHFDEFYKWVDKIVEEKKENITKNQSENHKKPNLIKTLRTASIDKEHIEDESNTVKEFISKQVTSKYTNEKENEILQITQPQTQQTRTETAMIITTKTKVISENRKIENITKEKSEESKLIISDIRDQIKQIKPLGKETTQNIKHEIKNDETIHDKENLTKPDSKETIVTATSNTITDQIMRSVKNNDKQTSDEISFNKTESKKSIKSDKIEINLPNVIKEVTNLHEIITKEIDSINIDTTKTITKTTDTKEIIEDNQITEKHSGDVNDLIKSNKKKSIISTSSDKEIGEILKTEKQ